MDIVLSRKGGVPVKEQTGAPARAADPGRGWGRHGQKLPSVRALARRLKIHHNTVSAAYQDLEGRRSRRAEAGRGSVRAQLRAHPGSWRRVAWTR